MPQYPPHDRRTAEVTQEAIVEWLDHPVSRRLLQRVRERLEARQLELLQPQSVDQTNHRAGQALSLHQLARALSDKADFLEY